MQTTKKYTPETFALMEALTAWRRLLRDRHKKLENLHEYGLLMDRHDAEVFA